MPSIHGPSVRLALVLEGLPNLLEDEGHCATGTGICSFGTEPVDKQLGSLRSHCSRASGAIRQHAVDGAGCAPLNACFCIEKRS